MRGNFVFALILRVALFTSAFGQTTKIPCYNEGIALAEQGKYDVAINVYNRAIDIDPQSAEA